MCCTISFRLVIRVFVLPGRRRLLRSDANVISIVVNTSAVAIQIPAFL